MNWNLILYTKPGLANAPRISFWQIIWQFHGIYLVKTCLPSGLAAPVLAAPVLAATVLAAPVLAAPVLAAPVLAAPVLAAPVLAAPVLANLC